jgi:ribosomal protein S18 acetylase RimI-like enzyme
LCGQPYRGFESLPLRLRARESSLPSELASARSVTAPKETPLRKHVVLIRAAHRDDADALVPLFEAWDHPQPAAMIAERLAEWQATPRAEILVAELDGSVGGVAAVCASPHLARPGRFARLVGLAVAEQCRRRGVASALMRAAEALAEEWECDRLELTSSRWREEAPAFYTALGYRDRSERQARYVREL